jgi:LmbE family N-acetylglucosaminyl deacetylase
MPTRIETEVPHDHLMGIWPHPDDEAYLSAGLMARMADAGRRVTVLTLTRGEKGTSDPADFDQPHFAERRERELRASLAELGVDDVRVLDYRDGELDRKRRALGQRASQTRPLAALMGEDTDRTWWHTEWFRRPTPRRLQRASTEPRVLPKEQP